MIKLKKENFLDSFKEQYDIEYLKEHFKNVYFIIGTAYAGKSTILKMLSEYYDGIHCKENYGLDYLKEYNVNNKSHPCLCYFNNHSMQDFVNRNPDEYYNWLRGSEIEITPIEIGLTEGIAIISLIFCITVFRILFIHFNHNSVTTSFCQN